ncbi:MAG TPA: IS1595 family transposase [Bacteroidia bacterium]|jgi:transposase-like protein|nr:IS1595 family transposase [Bacteroidia bacterium]
MATNLINTVKKYDTQAKCLSYLIKLRWGKTVKCPFCAKNEVREVKTKQGQYFCKNCNQQFSIFTGTIFEGTLLPLPKWFTSIALVLNAKSGMAAKELERNLELTYKTAYYTAMRIRIGMLIPKTKLHGIIEMDESYFGGKKRKQFKLPDNEPSLAQVDLNRGRGANKVSVAGMVSRKGSVKTQVIEKLTQRNLLAMLKHYASSENAILVTDNFQSYKNLEGYIDHLTVNHSKQFSKGITHINTIEGFWSYVKNGIKGSYKAISKKYLPFYLIEFEWKFNHRNFRGNEFETFLKNALAHPKELYHWKAKSTQRVKEVAYA